MARKARPQYKCTGNFAVNGVLLKDQFFTLTSECDSSGNKATKKLSTHAIIKAVDTKFFKEHDIAHFDKQRISKDSLNRFFTLTE